MSKPLLLAATAMATLSACNVREDDAAANAANPTVVTTAPAETAEPATATSVPIAPPITVPAIQTQPGPKGNTVALNKVAVTGNILTVSMTYSGGSDCCVHIPIDDVSIIDDATSQRISVLKDGTGKYMAAPLESGGRNVGPDSHRSASVVWFKFPAPPATSKTVSIAIPDVAPFDAVPVTR